MRVLADLHHHALAESLLMLFEDRFGWEVWFPQGMDWFDREIWNFERAWHGDAVAKQYLMGWWDGSHGDGDILRRPDPRHPWRVQKGVSLSAAQDMEWDYVISTLPHNDVGLHGFSQARGAKFGVQVGNHLQDSRWDLAEFILSSSTLPGLGLDSVAKQSTYQGKPCVVYHQEFSTDVFHYAPTPSGSREVASWVNCFPEGPSYPDFLAFARRHSDEFDFKVYGAVGTGKPDEFQVGDVSLVLDVAEKMRDARVAWHTKHWSDGFGHTIHNWFAIGRPVVGYRRFYADKLAGALWVEGQTGFDVEPLDDAGLLALLRKLRDDDAFHWQVCQASQARFREVVDFKAEADAIAAMLG